MTDPFISILLFLGVFGIMSLSLIVFGVTNEMDNSMEMDASSDMDNIHSRIS